MATPLEARLFGPPELRWRDERVDPRSRKGLLLLVRAMADPAGVPRHEACELLWTSGSFRNLRQQLYLLRRLPGAEHWLDDGDPVRIRVDSDLVRFTAALEEARHADALRHAGADRMPLVRWPTILEGVDTSRTPAFAEWLTLLRARTDDALRGAMRSRADQLEREGRPAPSLALLRCLVESDPLDEAAHRAIMRLEFRRGRFQLALAQFESCRRVLQNELNVEPLQETAELARAIEGRAAGGARLHLPPRLPIRLLRPPILVGREREWQLMEQAWSEGRTIFLTGSPGVGKTRLMMDFVRSKGRYLLLEGYPGDRQVPYSVMVRALKRILAEVPEIEVDSAARRRFARIAPHLFPDAVPVDPADDESRGAVPQMETFLDLMRQLRSRVDALPADDIQYYDRFTRELGFRITAEFARHGQDGGASTVAAFRKDEISPSQWSGITTSVGAGMALLIELQPLNRDGVARVLSSLDFGDDAETIDRLHRYTGGNPMFLIETLKGMLGASDPAGVRSPNISAPQRVASIIEGRLSALPSQALSLLRAAAIVSRELDLSLVQRMLDLPQASMMAALEATENAGWIHEGRFVHDVVQEVVMRTTPPSVRRLLHRRAAEVQEEQGAQHGRTARHYDGAGDRLRASEWWLKAGQQFLADELDQEAAEAFARAADRAERPEERAEALLGEAAARVRLEDGADREAKALRMLDGLTLRPEQQERLRLIHLELRRRTS